MITDETIVKQMIAGGMTECPNGMVDPDVWNKVKAEVGTPTAVVENEPSEEVEVAKPQAQTNNGCYKMSDALRSSGLPVDKTLKIKSGVIYLEKDAVKTPIKVKVDFSQSHLKQTVKCQNKNGDVEYFHTYDGQTENYSGRDWQECVNYCQTFNEKNTPFKSADVFMTLIDDVYDEKGKTIVAPKGTTIGHSLSLMNYKVQWLDFINACVEAKKDIDADEVDVEIGTERCQSKDGKYSWTSFTFSMI